MQGTAQVKPAWQTGLWDDPNFFPIAVWLQDPSMATRYKQAGINLYVGLWEGPTEKQLADLQKAGMPVICSQNETGLAHRGDMVRISVGPQDVMKSSTLIAGWMHGDEPDNAQPMKDPKTGKDTWGPCVPPATVVKWYEDLKKKDDTRPIILNLGQGVANDEWIGRGNGASLKDYETYVKGADIVSFDVYPVAGLPKPDPENYLWYVPTGIDRLIGWTFGKKPVWNCVECTAISGKRKATPEQVRSEVWMAIIHGSKGLIYFVHRFQPKFNEHALLDDPPMLAAVTKLNRQIEGLAPVLNTPTISGAATVSSANADVPISVMAKRRTGALYVFACSMRNAATKAHFTVAGLMGSKQIQVLDENRTVALRDGVFEDEFAPYGVHIYEIR